MIEMADADTAARVALRLVLQRGAQLGRRLVALRFVEELEPMAVRIEKAVRGAVPDVAVGPLAVDSRRFERGDAARERLGAVRAVGDVPHSRLRSGGQLQRRTLVVAEAAQVDRVAALAGNLHAEDLSEVRQALVGPRRQQLDMREVREVADGLGQDRYPRVSACRCSARRLASAMIVSDGLTESVRGTTEPSPT